MPMPPADRTTETPIPWHPPLRHVPKPWGYEIWWAQTDVYAAKLLSIDAGHRLSLQFHREKDESCYVLSGRVRLIKGPHLDALNQWELAAGACWRNRPNELHTIEAIEDSLVIEASTPHLDDVVRLLDDYGRVEERPEEPLVAEVVGHRHAPPSVDGR
jgi:mannose-6-phosphate isomerase